jgi:serine/threonine-protein kinase
LTELSDCRSAACEVAALLAIAPDGQRIAYTAGRGAQQRIYLRDLDRFESRPIAGTERGSSPLFSPDGQTLAFIVDQKLKKVSIDGGTPVNVYEPAQSLSTWDADDRILLTGLGNRVWRISINDGSATPVTTVTNEIAHRHAEILPGGKALVFSALLGGFTEHVYAQSLATGERRDLGDGSGPHYLATGHLVYVVAGRLMAARFDPVTLEVKGTPSMIVDGIRVASSGHPQLGFSKAGTMVYVPATSGPRQTELVWVDLNGTEHATGAVGRPHAQPRLSPDGRSAAVALTDSSDIWQFDLSRETWARLTFDGTNAFPLWTPDGARLTFTSRRTGPNGIYWKPADGNGPDQPLQVGTRANVPLSWSPDGRVLAFVSVDPKTGQDIWTLTLADKEAKPFLQTPYREGAPTFSPDGRWLAYASDESGRSQVYVRPFPGPGQKWTISTDGGIEPVWPKKSRQLFYRNGDAMMAVDIATEPAFSAGKPRLLFEGSYLRSDAFWANYDVTADGQRLLMVKRDSSVQRPSQINVVLNWFTELQQRVPPR